MGERSESTGREYMKYLTTDQVKAVKAANDMISKVGGCNLLGQVGCGKTPTAESVCQERAVRNEQREIALWLMPKMGGVVFDQTVEESRRIGISEHVFVWNDGGTEAVEEFLAAQRALSTPGVSAVVTNIQRLDAEVSKLLSKENASSMTAPKKGRVSSKKFSLSERASARNALLLKLGKFHQLWIDEYQSYAAASPSHDPNVEVNLQLSHYPIIDQFVQYNRPSCILGTTATPFMKFPNDIYCFVRLFGATKLQKRHLMTCSKYGSDEERQDFKRACNVVMKDMTVVLRHDAAPRSTRIEHAHALSQREVERHDANYVKLVDSAKRFKRAILSMPAHPTRLDRSNLERFKNAFCTMQTLCRRGASHPALFDPRPTPWAEQEFRDRVASRLAWLEENPDIVVSKTDECFEPSDSEDEGDGEGEKGAERRRAKQLRKKRAKREERDFNERVDAIVRRSERKFAHTREQLVAWRKELKDRWPLEDCLKFKSIVNRLAEVDGERAVIMFEHIDTIELLKLYINDVLPQRQVYMYHGQLGDAARVATLNAFKRESACDAILLSTRQALNQAVNVECTTFKRDEESAEQRQYAARMFFGDFADSPSAQSQAEGRCKRPKAQGYPDDPSRVREWFNEFFYSNLHPRPTIETVLAKMNDVKELRCADILHQKTDSEQESVDDGNDEGNKKVLTLLIEILAEHDKSHAANMKRAAAGVTDARAKRARP